MTAIVSVCFMIPCLSRVLQEKKNIYIYLYIRKKREAEERKITEDF